MAEQTQNEGWALFPKYVAGFVIGALVFVAVPESIRWLNGMAFAQQPTYQQPGGGNCNNYGTFSGTMNNNCPTIIGPIPRRFSDARFEPIKSRILAEFPKDKKISVLAVMGDNEAYQLALDIEEFLKQNDFQLGIVVQVMFDRPIRGLTKKVNPDGSIEIQVGSNQ